MKKATQLTVFFTVLSVLAIIVGMIVGCGGEGPVKPPVPDNPEIPPPVVVTPKPPEPKPELSPLMALFKRNRCLTCHGEHLKKPKGEFVLSNDALIDFEDVVRRVKLPAGEEEAMPPKGSRMSDDDIKFLQTLVGA